MMCLKITKALSIISMIIASELRSNPNNTIRTPHLDTACRHFLSNWNYLSSDQKIECECLCKKMNDESKILIEKIYDFNTEAAKKQNLSLKDVTELFGNIFKYLQNEIDVQKGLIEYISNETDEFPGLSDNEFILFVVENSEIGLKKLYSKYIQFIINQILKTFHRDITRLKVFDIPDVLKANVVLTDCIVKHLFEVGRFERVSEVIRFVNSRMLFITETLAIDVQELDDSLEDSLENALEDIIEEAK